MPGGYDDRVKDRIVKHVDMDFIYDEARRLGKDPSEVFMDFLRDDGWCSKIYSDFPKDWLQQDLYKYAEGLNPPPEPLEPGEIISSGPKYFEPVFKVIAGRQTRVWTEEERVFVEESVATPQSIAITMGRTVSSVKREQSKIALEQWAERTTQEYEERERERELEYERIVNS